MLPAFFIKITLTFEYIDYVFYLKIFVELEKKMLGKLEEEKIITGFIKS